MKNIFKLSLTAIIFSVFALNSSAVNRAWVGQGSGGGGTNFNTGTNWSPAGVPTSADNCTMTFTSACTITLSANITINDLTVNGNVCGTNLLRVMAFTLTINGTARFNANNFCNPVNYNVIQLDAVNGVWLFNGNAYMHNSGNGNTYMMANTASPGDMIFRGALVRFGQYAQTSPGTEPDFVFDRAGAMTINCKNTTYHVKGESLTFGLVNSPTVTITGQGTNGMFNFQPYNGNCAINNTTIVSIRDTGFINSSTTLQRYVAGGSTFSMAAGSRLNYGSPNVNGGFSGYATYTLNATSTVNYASSGWQDMQPITYGIVILDGMGNAGLPEKYSNGVENIMGTLTIQNFGEYNPRAAGGIVVWGNTLIQTGGAFDATRNGTWTPITHTFKSNFTNNGTWTNGTSAAAVNTALFNGTANQTISGTGGINFWSMTCNKASGTLILGKNITVGTGTAGTMNFQAGPLALSGFTLTINNTSIGSVVRTSGYAISENISMNSRILWQGGSTIAGAHLFPFGTSTGVYIPFTFNVTTANAGNVTLSTYKTNAGNAPLPPTVLNLNSTTGLTCASVPGNDNCDATVDRFWQITVTGTPTATITFSYDPLEIGVAPYNVQANQRAQRYDVGTNKWQPALAGQSTVGTAVTVPGVTTFSPWGMASNLSPLPISLISFEATPGNNNVLLDWTTATEINNDYFTIERSADGINFEKVGNVPSQAMGGNSTSNLYYNLVDENPLSGISYYR